MSLRFDPLPIDEPAWDFLGLDEESSLSQGLVALCDFNLGNQDLANASRTFTRASGVVGSQLGFGANLIASSSSIVPSNDILLAAGADYTCIAQVDNVGLASGNPGFWRDASPSDQFNIIRSATGRPWIRCGGVDVMPGTSGFAITTGRPITFGFRVRSARDAAFASDGYIRVSATHSTATTAANINNLCYQNTAAEMITGTWTFFAFWSRGLTDAEFESVTAAPRQMLRRLDRMVFFTAAPGGASNAPRYFHRTQMGMS